MPVLAVNGNQLATNILPSLPEAHGQNLDLQSSAAPLFSHDLHGLHQEEQNPILDQKEEAHSATAWNNLRQRFFNGPDSFQFFRNYFTLALNAAGIGFNTLAVVANNSNNLFTKSAAKFIDTKAEWYSRCVIPFGFAWNGIEAIMGNRPVEAFSRLIPAVSFFLLPFYNFNMATGLSSGLNRLLELVQMRHGGKHPGEHSPIENFKAVTKTSMQLFKEVFTGKASMHDVTEMIPVMLMLGGGVGGFALARNSRDSWPARIFGNFRNIGGIITDYHLVFNKEPDKLRSFHQKVVGGCCSVASVLNIVMRWVNPELARAINHIAIAVDDFGLTYWAQSSKRENEQGANKVPMKEALAA